ncbi:MAG: sulfite exporter TauE/SafE family protein [Firmicutes bacterium]|nr:sulfite exporter TauE/SafE family protein [Bacillota bacterium]
MENILFSGAMTFMLIGIFAGILFPILGNVGSFMVVPLLIIFTGLPPEIAIPIGLAHLAALIVPAAVSQWQVGNVDYKLLLLFLLGLFPGMFLANKVSWLMEGSGWSEILLIPYLLLLVGAVLHRIRPFPLLPKPNNRYRKRIVKVLRGLPGKTSLTASMMQVPLIIPVAMGLVFAFTGKLLGPVVALMVSPFLIVCLDIPVMMAVGTAMVANFTGMLAVALDSGFLTLPINLQILLWLFLGSSLTVLVLSAIMQRRPYPVPVAAGLVLITSVTLWVLTTSQPGLNLLIQHFSFPINLLGWFGGVRG